MTDGREGVQLLRRKARCDTPDALLAIACSPILLGGRAFPAAIAKDPAILDRLDIVATVKEALARSVRGVCHAVIPAT